MRRAREGLDPRRLPLRDRPRGITLAPMDTFPPPSAPPHIKVCGLRRSEDALLAIELGASFIGLIFAEGTPRCLQEDEAVAMLAAVRARASAPVRPVGVFVHEPIERVSRLVDRLGLVAAQFHAPRTDEELATLPVPSVRVVRVKGPESAPEIEHALARGPVLLDTHAHDKHGGTGRVFDHAVALPWFARGKVFIAGGLNPENIGGIVAALEQAGGQPYAFDASSGLEESPGVKSHDRMRRFFAAARG